jgi:aminomethyltransferase
MPLYGHELSEKVDSLTAGQGWCVDLTKEFIGAGAMRRLKEEGLPRVLIGLKLDGRRIARQHNRVWVDDRDVGEITSGTLSPTLGMSIAMAYVAREFAGENTGLEVEVGRRRVAATVVKLPFYKRPK